MARAGNREERTMTLLSLTNVKSGVQTAIATGGA